MKKVFKLFKYVLEIFVFPYTLCMLIVEYYKFRKYIKIIENAINSNDDFFNYLDKYKFTVDWLNRLYSVQEIPKPFKDFDDDELYDITMRSLSPMMKLIEKSVLIDVCSVIVSRINDDYYIVCITPYNYPKFKHYMIYTFISLIIFLVLLICYLNI